jgi:CubicO group peptidase (beta-lactamase class C family)
VQLHLRDGEINGRQLISKSEISKMRNSYSAIEELETNLANLNQVTDYSYGRFWRNYFYHTISGAHLKVIEHTGVSAGSSSIISFIPVKKIGIIVLTNKQTSVPLIIRAKFLQYLGEN